LPGATSRGSLVGPRDSRRAPRRSLLSMGLSAALVIAVGAIVALLLSRRVQSPPAVLSSQPAIPTSVTVTREPVPAEEPTVKPEETLPPVPSDSVAPPSPRTAPPRGLGRRTVKPVKPVESSAPPPKPHTGPFVSPIRNPGF